MSLSDATPGIAPGRVLGGRYSLVTPLARGGMAEVWEAEDEVLSRSVAVKLLQPHLAEDEVFVERFRREAITAARLSSPTIVATYDTGADAGTAYIVMELVRGRTLRQLLAGSGPLDPAVAVSIAMQIADALAHAHRAGLVHRDIKPANVLVCEEDGTVRVKVTDFGIAKARAGAGSDLTQTGMVLGTPKYLSPEQVEGMTEPDTRSDLYALGVVLFEMLTGRPPFLGKTDMATALAHLREEAPHVSAVRPSIEPALDALVASLLAKAPADRPPTAVAARQALELISRRSVRRPVPAVERTPTTGLPVAPALSGSITARIDGAGLAPSPSLTQIPTPPPGPVAVRRRRRRPGRMAGFVVGTVVVAAVVVATLLLVAQRGGRSGRSGGSATGTSLTIRDVTVYMDNGHPPDNPTQTGFTFDGNPATVWSTDLYTNSTFGNLYDGEGLAIQLADSSSDVATLAVDSPTDGWAASVYVSTKAVPSGGPLAGWGAPLASKTAIEGSTTFDLGSHHGGWLLLWLTNLGPADRVAIAELTVKA